MTEETTPAAHSAPFLSQITLRNFKSVVSQDVSLAPLTLIVGENSSGKSSLFQAVRLMQQAARSKTSGSSFFIGDSINVGYIEQVRSIQAKEEESISIGFDVGIPYSYLDDNHNHHRFDECTERGDCSPCHDYWSIKIWQENSIEDRLIIRWEVDLGAEESGSTALQGIYFSLGDINGDEPVNFRIIQEDINNIINLSSALPNTSIIQQITANDLALELITQLIGHPKEGLSKDKEGGKDLIECVLDNIAEMSDFKFPQAISEIPELIDLGCELIKTGKVSNFFPLIPVIASYFEIEEQEVPMLVLETRDHDILTAGAHYLDKLCDNNIKYLGPLREPPDQPTPRAAPGQTGDIGQSGEFTASVLQRFGSERVLAPTPDGELSEISLIEAVQEWGRHLGLLQTIRVVQEARLGNTIYVESEGLNKEVPLDAVGVGVSQLLPVLVLCLLSEPGSMILLEQPELHLHPALQQRLADFLIAAVRSGRQLIVETHSEYIVSRLRRRIAEDTSDEDKLLSMSKIVFAERDSQTGITTYREVELSPFGKIEDWPRGFFDQASEEEREIIRSGFRKIADREGRIKETENEDAADV